MSRTAASLSYADVNDAINGTGPNFSSPAPDGETINLPAGVSATAWSNRITVSVNLTIQGTSRINAARDGWITGTTIKGSSTGTFRFSTTESNTTCTLKGVDIDTSALTGNFNTINMSGLARFNGTNGGFRITEVRFFYSADGVGGQKQIEFDDAVTGVVDHCFYDVPIGRAGVTNWLEIDPASQPGFPAAKTPVGGATFTAINVTLQLVSPGTVTLSNHGLKAGQGVMFLTAGSLPTGITTNKVYYVKTTTANTFTISAVPFGTAINFTGSQSGQQQIKVCNNWPTCGLYNATLPWDWGNDFSAICIEDCLIQRHGFTISMSDGPTQPGGGGARVIFRHNGNWGNCSPHGWDESSPNVGGVVVEAYNNVWYTPVQANTPAMHNMRSGSLVCFNNRSIGYQQSSTVSALGRPDFFHANANPINHVHGGMDGTCFMDQNARGGRLTIKTDLPTSQTWVPWETTTTGGAQTLGGGSFTLNVVDNTSFPPSGNIYVNTTANGTQSVVYTGKGVGFTTFTGCSGGLGSAPNGTVVVGPLNIVVTPTTPNPNSVYGVTNKTFAPVQYQLNTTTAGQIDTSRPGVPVDTRIGAVYAQGSGATGQNTYTLPLASSTDDQWVGFTIRNKMGRLPVDEGSPNNAAEVEQSGGGANHGDASYRYVTGSSINGANSTIINVSGKHDPIGAGDIGSIWDANQNWEMRFVVNGLGLAGQGPGIPLTDGRVYRISFFETVNGNTKYYCNPPEDGVWYWDNKGKNTLAGTIFNSTWASTGSMTRLVHGGIHDTTKVSAGYPTQSNTAANLRIGTDWDSGTFGGRNLDGSVIADFRPYVLNTDPTWPATSAAGATYPHPLVGTPTNSPPSMPATGSATWSAGVSSSYSVTTGVSGVPFPTFTKGTVTPTAAWLSLSSGGLLTATSPVAGTYTFVITATNSSGTDTQNFTLTVQASNAAPTCSITSPANNASFLTTDTVVLTATGTDSDGNVTQIQFFDGGVSLGTVTASPAAPTVSLSLPGQTFTAGVHALTAKATDNGTAVSAASATVTINVGNPIVPTVPPPTIVIYGGTPTVPPPTPVVSAKQILLWSVASSNNRIATVVTNKTYVDTLPFDGLVLSSPSYQNLVGPASVVDYTTFSNEVSPINGALTNVRYNYYNIMPGNTGMQDPFDSWTQTIANFVTIARVCREQGLTGIFFDNEEYNVSWWTYPTNVAHAGSHTLAAYQAEWRARGVDTMNAILAEWPAARVVHTLGPNRSVNTAPFSGAFSGSASWLGGYFFTGMFEASPTGNHTISGGELYYLRTASHFSTTKAFLDTIYTQNSALFSSSTINPLWLANDNLSWGIYDQDTGNPVNGGVPMTAAILQTTLQNAVPNADEFVWNYSESPLEWLTSAGGTATNGWQAAVRAARATLGLPTL